MTTPQQFDRLFVNGQWVNSTGGNFTTVVSPHSEQVIARVVSATVEDVDRAVQAARRAFDEGPWPRMDLSERIAILRRVSEAMEEQEEEIASLVSTEMGCPISLARTMQSRNPRILLDTLLDVAPTVPWTEVRRSASGTSCVVREPLGVVAAITPWNAPLLAMTIKLIPALLAGCTAVIKPSSDTPLSTYRLVELLEAAGLPAGVVNFVPCGRRVGESLVGHPGVDKVSFTGSTEAGRRIAALCGQDLRRVSLELGGKSAAVVLDDADLDLVLENIKTLSFRNTGQVCSNKTRIIVPRSLREEVERRLVELIESLVVGDPADPQTTIGPLVTQGQRERVEHYIERGHAEGARLLVGGGRPVGLDRGWFVSPTVFTDVTPEMTIFREEIFGPVIGITYYDEESEAVELANASQYGLSGSVFSADESRAAGVARRIRTGTVEVNGRSVGWQSPVGGFKDSGIGREAGREGIEAFTELKSLGISEELAGQFA